MRITFKPDLCRIACFLGLGGAAPAAVLDRIAVTVGNEAITESEVLEEIRVASFLNSELLDFSPAARRAAAERLVDQYLIRRELAVETNPQADGKQAEEALDDLVKKRFRSRELFGQKLKQYGITEQELLSHLQFQIAVIHFTDLRFNVAANEADRAVGGGSQPPAGDIDQRLDSWLKQLRSQARIEFKKGAFQ
jgi:hypothetical protein